MPWIEGSEAEVLSLVGLSWLTNRKGRGVLGCLCALAPHPDLRGLHGHNVVFMLAVQDPGAPVCCGEPLWGWPSRDQHALLHK